MAATTVSVFLRLPIICGALWSCAATMGGHSATAGEQRYEYRVHMAPYGDIGTYSSAVDKVGDATTITTQGHFKVSVLGIPLYTQDFSRVEREVGNRLVYFHGVTVENGKSSELDGRAEGDHFRLTSPSGQVNAPATIRTSGPWSVGSPGGNTIFMTDTGVIARVLTTGGERTSITIGGATLQVRRYQIDTADGQERYEVWIDDHQIPAKFSRIDSDGTITFTLSK
jgi:Domain of unknown function (DUF6134)